MEIIIAAIGKQKQSPELELLTKYVKQTRWKVTVREFEDKKSSGVKERMQKKANCCCRPFPKAALS